MEATTPIDRPLSAARPHPSVSTPITNANGASQSHGEPVTAMKIPKSTSKVKDQPTTPMPDRFNSSSSLSSSRASSPSKSKSAEGQAGINKSNLRSPTSIKTPLRRESSNSFGTAPYAANKSSPITPNAKSGQSAGEVARRYFISDLESHLTNGTPSSGLDVILHDACYGHRFSRPKTSKANLSTIVERPERILACALGVATAYVLLGERHEGGRFAPKSKVRHSQKPFTIKKSTRKVPLTAASVTQVHGAKWMTELKTMCENAEAKLISTGKELVRPPIPGVDTVNDTRPKFHEGDLYLCSESLNALEGALGGVYDAVDSVFSRSGSDRAFVCVRPPGHHCSDDYPSGFCWINNVHAGISHAILAHGLTHAAIIDFDLHHGDGSQTITWAHNARVAALPKNAPLSKRTSIGYFSIHDINSYPCEWGDQEKVQNASLCIENAHNQTIWNVHLQPWKTEQDFWKLYEDRYAVLIEKTRVFLKQHFSRFKSVSNAPEPKAAIFISAGFDASEHEGHGMQRHKVYVPTEFYARFTREIVALAREAETGCDGRVISVLEGGYSDRALMSGVLSHISGLTDVTESAPKPANPRSRNSDDNLTEKLEALNLQQHDESTRPGRQAWSRDWWSAERLHELETLVATAPQLVKPAHQSTYDAPTQASQARAAANVCDKPQSVSTNPLSEEPPLVDWCTASHELTRLLVPDRQTRSYEAEDLKVEATKVRKARLSGQMEPHPTTHEPALPRLRATGRQGSPNTVNTSATEPSKPVARNTRRRTLGDQQSLNDLPSANDHIETKQMKRRTSIASSVISNTEDQNNEGPNRTSSVALGEHPPPVPPLPSHEILAKKVKAPRSPTKPKVPKPTTATALPSRTKPLRVSSSGTPLASNSTAANATPELSSNAADVNGISNGLQKLTIKFRKPVRNEANAAIEIAKTTAPEAENDLKKSRKTKVVKVPISSADRPAQTANSVALTATSETEPHSKTALQPMVPDPQYQSPYQASSDAPTSVIKDDTDRQTVPPDVKQDLQASQLKQDAPLSVPHSEPDTQSSQSASTIYGTPLNSQNVISLDDATHRAAATESAINQPPVPREEAAPKQGLFNPQTPIRFALLSNTSGNMIHYPSLTADLTTNQQGLQNTANVQTKQDQQPYDVWAVPDTPGR